jgi:transcriptional regulator with GAF, ATPase, and Fis domain
VSAANVVVSSVADAAGTADGAAALTGLPTRYVPGERLGEGASGTTYAALDTSSGAACVIKVVSEAARAHGIAEYRGLVGLAHPGVVRVRDIGRLASGRIYLVTDRLDGPGLGDIASIADDERRRARFTRAAQELAGALAYMHGRGVVHGDVSPANVRLAGEGEGARAVLIDFGLAGPPRPGDGRACGTLGYAAPEALTGARTPASDLFALGATLYETWSGAPPFGRGLAAVQRMLTGRAPALSSVRAGLGGDWDRLFERLLATDPAERPASAREVMRALGRLTAGAETPTEIDLAIPYPEGDPLEGLFVGRRGERAALRAAFDQLAEGTSPAVLALVGPPGSGRRTLFDVVAREVAVAVAAGSMPAVDIWRGDVESLARFAGFADDEPRSAGRDAQRASEVRLARLCEALEARAEARPLCVALTEGAAADVLAAFVAGAPPRGRLLLVLPMRALPVRPAPFLEAISLAPLEGADVTALLAGAGDPAPPAEAGEAIARAAQGNAAMVGVLARRLVAELRAGRGGEISVSSGADLDGLLAAGFAALPPEAQAVVVALALGDEVDAGADGVRAAWAAGWLTRDEAGALCLPSGAHRQASLGGAPAALRSEVAARALLRLSDDDPRRADALAAAGHPDEAARLLRAQARAARKAVSYGRAADLLGRAAALAPQLLEVDDWLELVTGLAVLGRYDAAAEALARAQALATEEAAQTRCCEREGWLRTRRGDITGACAALERGLARRDDAALRARLGRLLVTTGRFHDALETIAPLLATGVDAGPLDSPVLALVAETQVLALAYAGEGGEARTRLAALSSTGHLDDARSVYLEGLLAQLAGDDGRALDGYRRAYALAARAADVHSVAAVTLNLGGLLADRGLYTEALAASDRAVRELGRLGAPELATALVNAANLFVQVGDLPAARRALERARSRASDRQVALALAPASFVEGDAERRAGRPAAALAPYRAAAAAFAEGAQPHLGARALFAAAEALAEAGNVDEARAQLAAAAALVPASATSGDDPARIDAVRARARVSLADGRGRDDDAALLGELDRLAAAARAGERRPVAWRLGALAARLAERAGGAPAAGHRRDFARTCFEEVRMATPEHHRAGLAQDPDAAWLLGGASTGGDAALTARALAAEGQLRRLLRINKRLNSEQRLPRLLELIVDTVIELTDAERGFLLLDDGGGDGLQVKVARNIDQQTLGTAAFELSRSIAQQAAAGGQPIVTIDAAGDARFREALSVSDLHLRSVLAVPLSVKGKVVGTIYVDHRLRKGAFDQDDVRHVLDFAEQAAIALENARLLAELRRRERQVEALNRRLETELAARREELSGMKQELRDNREALAVRYDYRNIVGRTPRMLELFRLLDRITDTALPVVIQGESGTGKELVARAIHSNGPRREGPFVGENCAAIAETLLESTLFGYVRGAFTGADRDNKGLFEIADGGTLFLDEVGEMSPAMQGKLLRVLQEGELRRVGSERTRKVDVRIVAATNRDLARMVDDGTFRRDLFFRLNVAAIALPPLRDRREDIPLMVEHFLAKSAAATGRKAPKPIDPAALARLCAYRWPGNVRELENELTRADAFSGERITENDLSPHVAATGDPGAVSIGDPDSLMLKPRVERLERALLREALGRAANNQTKAAEMLGLSRFGLQKKLKRYRFA